MAEEEEDDDVFTIMVATDSHLGYCDRDAVRGTDSFAAFEEVLRLASRGADFLLLAAASSTTTSRIGGHAKTMNLLSVTRSRTRRSASRAERPEANFRQA